MLNKREFNFFSGQELEVKRGNRQKILAAVAGLSIILLAISGILFQRYRLNQLNLQIDELTQKLDSQTVQDQLKEYAVLNTQLTGLDEYMALSKEVLQQIANQQYASTDKIAALEKLLPSGVEVMSLSIAGADWNMECRTNNQYDIALLLHNINESSTFANATASSLSEEDAGIISFPLHFVLKEGVSDAAE